MEGIVKNNNLGQLLAENIDAGSDALNVSGVVERSKVAKALNALDNLVGNKHAFIKQRAALNYAVTDGGDFAQIVDNLCVALGENLFNLKESFGVVFKRNLIFKFASVSG